MPKLKSSRDENDGMNRSREGGGDSAIIRCDPNLSYDYYGGP